MDNSASKEKQLKAARENFAIAERNYVEARAILDRALQDAGQMTLPSKPRFNKYVRMLMRDSDRSYTFDEIARLTYPLWNADGYVYAQEDMQTSLTTMKTLKSLNFDPTTGKYSKGEKFWQDPKKNPH